MRIAIVGSGISGLVCAHLLHPRHDVHVFEGADWIGGHTHTVDVELPGPDGRPRRWSVDTGFIVHNERTYPNFVRLLSHLGVDTVPTEMSFSVRCERSGLEYNATSLSTLYAQRRNLFRPSFQRMVLDILRFQREGKRWLEEGGGGETLGEWWRERRYSEAFVEQHLVPMASAVWSADPEAIADFPAATFLRFFANHGFLELHGRPQWRVVAGGSARYVEKLAAPFADRVRLRTPVLGVTRDRDGVTLRSPAGPERFDHVIFACHSDEALALLETPTQRERTVLGVLRYQANDVVLHTDASLLPRRRRAWAAWNAHLPEKRRGRATLTYCMNRLQHLDAPEPLCVTLNRSDAIAPERVLGRFVYAHPQYDAVSDAARLRWDEINVGRTSFCGAYWGYGFHEDGVVSALAVCERFGARLP